MGTVTLAASWLCDRQHGDGDTRFLSRSPSSPSGRGCLGGCLGFPTPISSQPQVRSHFADKGRADCPAHPGLRPRFVHGSDVTPWVIVEKLFDEARLAQSSGRFLGFAGGCLCLGSCPGFSAPHSGQLHSCLVEKRGADGPVEAGSFPCRNDGFAGAFGMLGDVLLDEAGLARGRSGGCLLVGLRGCLLGWFDGFPRAISGQPQLLSYLANDGVADRSFHPGSFPRFVHGLGIPFGMVVEELLHEGGLTHGDCRHVVVSLLMKPSRCCTSRPKVE